MSKSYSVPSGKQSKGKPEAAENPVETPAQAEGDSKKEKKPPVQCCIPGCLADAVTRGLCSKCYSAASNLVKGKKATWEELEKLGLAKPSQRDPSPNKFLEALTAKQAK